VPGERRSSVRPVPVLVATLCITAGCYDYHPLTAPSPEAGSYVAATLTEAGSVDLTRYLGPEVFVVRGRYLGAGEAGIVVSVASVELKRGNDVSWAGETIVLPGSAVASLEVRRLAKGRTVLLAGAGAGGLVFTTLAFSLLGNSGPIGAGGGHPGRK
jgi:hypothetical protein